MNDPRAVWPDAPSLLLEYVAARVVLARVLRHFNEAACALDDATTAYFRATPDSATRLDRLMLAAEAERTRAVAHRWADVLACAARLTALRRDRYAAWNGRRAFAAERAGRTPDPPYVLPEARGDAYPDIIEIEIGTPLPGRLEFSVGASWRPYRDETVATLRMWSRLYATLAQR